MMPLETGFYIQKTDGRLCQGSVLSDVVYRYTDTVEEGIKVDEITLPYVVVLNQDCELEQDFNERNKGDLINNDKHLTSFIVLPAFVSGDVKEGKHFESFGLQMRSFNSGEWKYVERNEKERYFHMKEDKNFKLPSLTIDFKHFYTIPYDELRKFVNENPDLYKCRINYFHREDLSRRFTSFTSRIAVPNEILESKECEEKVE